jgi:hypothetical protein
MTKIKLIVVGLVATVASSALTASVSAAEWYVNGTPLLTTVGLSTATKIEQPLVLTVPSLPLTLKCASLSGVKPELVAKAGGRASELVFGGCKVTTGPSGCELEESAVPTEPVEALLATGSKAPDDKVTFKAQKSKNLFAAVPFNTHCASLSGTQPVDGTVVSDMPTGQTELVEQPLVGLGTKEPAGLTVAGDAAYLSGQANLKLLSGLKWSYYCLV